MKDDTRIFLATVIGIPLLLTGAAGMNAAWNTLALEESLPPTETAEAAPIDVQDRVGEPTAPTPSLMASVLSPAPEPQAKIEAPLVDEVIILEVAEDDERRTYDDSNYREREDEDREREDEDDD